jgi:hypothetical protein
MELSIQDNLEAFSRAFGEYLAWTSKAPQEALERKVKNLGIRLYQGFTAHRFGGVPRRRGVALSELRSRTDGHRGTTVRPELLAQYEVQRTALLAQRTELRAERRTLLGSYRGKGQALAFVAASIDLAKNALRRVGAWQAIVGKEVALRQSGIGELGAAFLWFRSRGKGENQRFVLNHSGRPIGSVSVDDGQAMIVGDVAGIGTVAERYDIVAKAISDETDDTLRWIAEQQDLAAQRIMGGILA